MKNKSFVKVLTAAMIMAVSFGTLAGCTKQQESAEAVSEAAGTLILKVNPEFEVDYDDEGNVLEVEAMNDDAETLMEDYKAYKNKSTREVITELVELMDEEGYIEKDEKGEGQDINLEVKYGSAMPQEQFLEDIITGLKGVFDEQKVTGKVVVTGESNYGVSEYEVSDYGNSNYKEVKTQITKAVSSGNSYTDYANTDYDGYNSDYDSNTDYDGTNTDYDSSDYGTTKSTSTKKKSTSSTSSKSNTNYSDYDSNSSYDNDSKYDTSDYGSSNTTSNKKPVASTSKPTISTSKPSTSTSKPSTSSSNDSDYDNDSNYDDSGYDNDSNYDNDSSYDDSDYDD